MNKIRVLVLIPNLRTGGAQQFTVTLLSELKRTKGVEPSIAVLDAPRDLDDLLQRDGFTIERFHKITAIPSLGWLVSLARRLNRRDYDVLQMHGASAAFWGCLLTAANPRLIRVVAYHTVHGWRKARKRWFTNRINRPFVHRYVAVCQAEKDSLAACYGVDPRKVEVIPNCVDHLRYRPGAPSPDARLLLGAPAGRPLAGCIGRYSVEKGGDIFIRAMALLKKEGCPVHGVLVGDGPARQDWQRLADELDVNDVVTFTGQIAQERMPDIIRSLDIGVLPSHQEACSVAILEQMACGIPMVATKTGGNADLVDHGRTGFMVPTADPSAMADAIRKLLQSPGDRQRFGKAARRHIETHYTIGAVTSRYASLYRTLVTPPDSRRARPGIKARTRGRTP